MSFFTNLVFRIFIWSGAKLFGAVAIYAPDDDVIAVHFGRSRQAITESCRKLAEDSLAPRG